MSSLLKAEASLRQINSLDRKVSVIWDKHDGIIVKVIRKRAEFDPIWNEEQRISCRNLAAGLRKFSKILLDDDKINAEELTKKYGYEFKPS